MRNSPKFYNLRDLCQLTPSSAGRTPTLHGPAAQVCWAQTCVPGNVLSMRCPGFGDNLLQSLLPLRECGGAGSLVGSHRRDGRLCPWLTALCQLGVMPGARTPKPLPQVSSGPLQRTGGFLRASLVAQLIVAAGLIHTA